MTNFPVRLAQEIYKRCLQYSPKKDNICLYDCCCCGGGFCQIEDDIAKECPKSIIQPGITINGTVETEEITNWLEAIGYSVL